MKKLMKKRAGFTLVELLIVIIIIGILAGAMLLVAGSGTDKAEATKIVSNLRSLKAAALMYYADNPNVVLSGDAIDPLVPYMDRTVDAAYKFKSGTITTGGVATTGWFVGMENITPAGARDKLTDVASSAGLLVDETISSPLASGDEYVGGANVYMRAR